MMAVPLGMQAESPAKTTAVKFFKWFCREGCLEDLGRVFVATSTAKLSTTDSRLRRHSPLLMSSATVIGFVQLNLQHQELAAMPGERVFSFESSFFLGGLLSCAHWLEP
jgi:hypothetical protein